MFKQNVRGSYVCIIPWLSFPNWEPRNSRAQCQEPLNSQLLTKREAKIQVKSDTLIYTKSESDMQLPDTTQGKIPRFLGPIFYQLRNLCTRRSGYLHIHMSVGIYAD
ncbi:hypothetical protein EUGRSUZ_A01439 [Eucalyptus grandis]|uniref:Uncharacterized protein n=2 Tax=Eucalyptus grandis TaxID=71139 RepID=A0ACC3M4G8_EUCGR|nr:hypothetical protein EUGRSUZ_A01439 [Eucalyptus grandis]